MMTKNARTIPISKKAVKRLADIATELDFEKNKYPEQSDRTARALAVGMIHGVATAHDQAGGYGVYAQDENEPCRLTEALEAFAVVAVEDIELLDGLDAVSDDEAEFLAGSEVSA
jgi:hypothetical protein